MIKKNLNEEIFSNSMITGLLGQIEDPKEREKTVRAILGILEQMHGKFDGLSQAYEELAKKQRSE